MKLTNKELMLLRGALQTEMAKFVLFAGPIDEKNPLVLLSVKIDYQLRQRAQLEKDRQDAIK